MRIEQLRYVEAVARVGSFRRAAEEMHVSQPALSEALRNLERELGIDLLVRTSAGARITDEGRELLPHMLTAIDAIDAIQRVAHDQHHVGRTLRIGTVNAATVTLLAPAVAELRRRHDQVQVEVVMSRQDEIHRALLEGSVDLGLVNYLPGDDTAPKLDTTVLLRGRIVVCLRSDDPLAAKAEITIDDLLAAPIVAMRSGYLMHRFLHRVFGDRTPPVPYATDGAEMGKTLVAEGLGVTLLPSYSVIGDPLERSGVITSRPLAGVDDHVLLALQQRTADIRPLPVRQLQRIFVELAAAIDVVAA